MIRETINCKLRNLSITKVFHNNDSTLLMDAGLMDYVGIDENDIVGIFNLRTGKHFELYATAGIRNSGCICLNVTEGNLSRKDDEIEIFTYKYILETCIKNHKSKLIIVDKLDGLSLY